MELGQKIKLLRTQAELTQQELAAKAGISRIALGFIERGGNAKVSTLDALAAALGLRLVWILED